MCECNVHEVRDVVGRDPHPGCPGCGARGQGNRYDTGGVGIKVGFASNDRRLGLDRIYVAAVSEMAEGCAKGHFRVITDRVAGTVLYCSRNSGRTAAVCQDLGGIGYQGNRTGFPRFASRVTTAPAGCEKSKKGNCDGTCYDHSDISAFFHFFISPSLGTGYWVFTRR